MAQYKVPQDIEADDKLIGPFSFRQFVYLIIAAGLCFVAFVLFQVFPLLVIIPIPFIIFLVILALPLKKDQPMETYLSAIVDFYLKPQKRVWMPGQVDTTITITAPKKTEENRTKDLSQEEASHRLSFLADIVDTEGYAIKDSNLRDDIASEAANTQDIFETSQTFNIDKNLEKSTENHYAQVMSQMQSAIDNTTTPQPPVISPAIPMAAPPPKPDIEHNAATIQPDMDQIHDLYTIDNPATDALDVALESIDTQVPETTEEEQSKPEKEPTPTPEPEPKPEPETPKEVPNEDLKNLANNSDFSVETIAKQAKRLEEKKAKDDGEVYISLH